jgi:hypothetical protein
MWEPSLPNSKRETQILCSSNLRGAQAGFDFSEPLLQRLINLAACGEIYASMDFHITNMSHRKVLRVGKAKQTGLNPSWQRTPITLNRPSTRIQLNATSLSEWYNAQISSRIQRLEGFWRWTSMSVLPTVNKNFTSSLYKPWSIPIYSYAWRVVEE